MTPEELFDFIERLKERAGIVDEAVCTCRDDQKQRALCPVCDKEKYDELKAHMKNINQLKK